MFSCRTLFFFIFISAPLFAENTVHWNPQHIFPDTASFLQALTDADACIAEIDAGRETLTSVAAAEKVLPAYYSCRSLVQKIHTYALIQRDTALTDTTAIQRKAKTDALRLRFFRSAAYIEPSLLKLPDLLFQQLLTAPALTPYQRPLTELQRLKPHRPSEKETALLALFALQSHAAYETYLAFTALEMPYREVRFWNNEITVADSTAFYYYRADNDRSSRKAVFDAYFGSLYDYRNTFARLLTNNARFYHAAALSRNYSSALEESMIEEALPPDFFTAVTAAITKLSPLLNRYLALKKEKLSVPKLKYYDLFLPLVPDSNHEEFTFEHSAEIIDKTFSFMPQEYRKTLATALNPGSGWIDIYPAEGKAPGAYTIAESPEIHPYILLNHTGDYEALSTLAHETAHALHRYFSVAAQPLPDAGYDLISSETIAITSEILVLIHLTAAAPDAKKKAFYLDNLMQMLSGIIFRQAMLCKFELTMHGRIAAGETLTADFLSEEYLQNQQQFYGTQSALFEYDAAYAMEWADIPHFYQPLYTCRYAAAGIAAAIAAPALQKGTLSSGQYMKLLRAGNSRKPLELLAGIGADFTSTAVYMEAARFISGILEELEKLTGKKKQP